MLLRHCSSPRVLLRWPTVLLRRPRPRLVRVSQAIMLPRRGLQCPLALKLLRAESLRQSMVGRRHRRPGWRRTRCTAPTATLRCLAASSLRCASAAPLRCAATATLFGAPDEPLPGVAPTLPAAPAEPPLGAAPILPGATRGCCCLAVLGLRAQHPTAPWWLVPLDSTRPTRCYYASRGGLVNGFLCTTARSR